MITALAAMVLCNSFSSCNKDDDDLREDPLNVSKEYEYKDYSEKGFWIDGEMKVCGYFDTDSIMKGYTKFVKCTADYRTVDGEEGVEQLGYRLSVVINGLMRFYSTDVTYNNDSTAISSLGTITLQNGDKQTYDATVTAAIDSIGKPHFITCKTLIGNKNVVLSYETIQVYQE